jgi:hypothetical protein
VSTMGSAARGWSRGSNCAADATFGVLVDAGLPNRAPSDASELALDCPIASAKMVALGTVVPPVPSATRLSRTVGDHFAKLRSILGI